MDKNLNRRNFLELLAKRMAIVGLAPLLYSSTLPYNNRNACEIKPIRAPFPMPQLKRPVFKERIFDVRNYGAVGDGITKNTLAIRKAIEICSRSGGGKVIIPKGKWFTGAIHLKSNVNLHLEEGAEVHFSDLPEDYLPVVFTRWAGFELMNFSPLIYANNCENIGITGPGKLFGHGEAWWDLKKNEDGDNGLGMKIQNEMVLKNVAPENRIFGIPGQGLRPQFISPINCKNVLLEDFSIVSSGPFWTIQLVYCENVIVRGLNIYTVKGRNNDGIDIDSTRNVLLENCKINTKDNCIAIKSGINEDGRRVARPSENIVIRNIDCSPTNGGYAIGSEMSGDVRNVLFQDCSISDSRSGIHIKSNASRGGTVENIWFKNFKMNNLRGSAIEINTDYSAWMSDKNGTAYPKFRDIHFSDISCNGAAHAITVNGKPEQPIENLSFSNIKAKVENGVNIKWVNGLKIKNVDVAVKEGKVFQIENCSKVKR